MNPRLAAAVLAGKAASGATRALRRGGGTALPGLVAERLEPALVRKLGRQLGAGCVLVTGTNGKTTTSRMIASMLSEARLPYLHNREGSNLMRGIASALLAAAGPAGNVPHRSQTAGIFETDEATLPAAVEALAPRAIAFTNLFRDQLDRYGEVDTVAALWREALASAPGGCTLVLNADDPSVAELEIGWPGPIHWFGLDDAPYEGRPGEAFDARWCRACGANFVYDRRFFAHVGWWRCTGCERVRRTPQTSAGNLRLGLDGAAFEVSGLGEVSMPLTGLYNVYNALAAASLARVLGLEDAAIRSGLDAVRAAFGRQEMVALEGRRLRLLLCKNPAGSNQVLRLLAGLERPLNIAVLLNDGIADGQDVSWIWDVDFELLSPGLERAWAGGDRAADIALRLKYAGWPPPAATDSGSSALLDSIIANTAPGEDVFVMPTYTAMLDLREELRRRGAVAHTMD